jgi:hypothetical protein
MRDLDVIRNNAGDEKIAAKSCLVKQVEVAVVK